MGATVAALDASQASGSQLTYTGDNMSEITKDPALYAAVAGIALIRSGSRPPPTKAAVKQALVEAPEEVRWQILFALILDLVRKSAYVFDAAKKIAEDLAVHAKQGHEIPQEITDLADLIIRHEEALQAYEQNCDWEDLVNELVHIIDGELKTPDRKSERRALLDDFASH
jgi:hypothetical protein